MNKNLRTVLAIVLGWVIGGVVNMSIVDMGMVVYPIEGLDPNDMDALAAMIPNLEPKFFVFPFLAHALGTFFGAFIAYLIATQKRMRAAWIIGGLFFIGGIMVNFLLPGNWKFTILDLVFAYFPFAFLGGKLGAKISPKKELQA
ncbi:MAG: hypothetical protein N4A41_00785 [Crocinitomicaceae bacterium]|jgi:mannose/fructose/N-acetylgalactosamine-specific phosphotransferase system component IID|nr:hypothetical protein [Crocinitomicaceae bacterium]